MRVRFDASPAEILPQLLTQVATYDPTISEVRFDHSRSSAPGEMGVGSVRICVFEDGRELHEPLLVYDPPHAYAYTVDQDASTLSLPVSEIVLAYEFADNNAGGTDLTVRVFFDPRIPGTGPVITPVLTGTVRRTFQTAVSVFGGEYLGDERP
ncbi:SRPBCC family protein [Jannaschia sp. CCS1]|uniref:SRPBCC family protein n=1 Tax=Jannaschia sp. (strain CCS1) TaxID=290400 RepID=UPI00140FF05C|nr:SRPBCC family protein [Jannaschia sp. CCS1]